MIRLSAFLVFFVIIFSVFGLMQLYGYRFYRRWVRRVYNEKAQKEFLLAAWIVLGVGNLLLILQFVVRGSTAYQQPLAQYVVVYPAGIFFAVVVLGFLINLGHDVVRLFRFWIRRARTLARQLNVGGSTSVERHSPLGVSAKRREFLKISGAATLGITFGTPLISSIVSARDYRISKIPVSFPNLPAGLRGLTIAQVSDVHSGVYMTEDHMAEIVELTNTLHADLVVLTGDHVDTSDIQIPPARDAMRKLTSEYGVYGCLGNHDHFATAEKVSAALQQVGITMLDNAHRALRINGETLSLIGVDDAGGGSRNFARLDDAMRGVEPDTFKILLSHRPEFFEHAKKAGIDLTLAGHTHGGQVGIEFWGINLNPAYLFTKYVRGLFKEEGRQLYVNVGVGMVGVPIRIVRPEITLMTLQRE
jgi:predicted MPP superfamily phosphohydrolase